MPYPIKMLMKSKLITRSEIPKTRPVITIKKIQGVQELLYYFDLSAMNKTMVFCTVLLFQLQAI